MKFATIREQCCLANLELVQFGLVDMTFGNVSVFDPKEQVFAIKPSGVDYEELKPKKMVIVDLEGNVVDGELRPSSDTPTHRCLYLALGKMGVRAVAHTHSRNAVAFAQAREPIPCFGTTHSDFFNGPVPVTRVMTKEEVQGEYEWETGLVIEESFSKVNPLETPAILVANHGPFTWGVTAKKAVEHALALEVVAEMAMKTLAINPKAEPVDDYLLAKHFKRKHGATAYYGQDENA